MDLGGFLLITCLFGAIGVIFIVLAVIAPGHRRLRGMRIAAPIVVVIFSVGIAYAALVTFAPTHQRSVTVLSKYKRTGRSTSYYVKTPTGDDEVDHSSTWDRLQPGKEYRCVVADPPIFAAEVRSCDS